MPTIQEGGLYEVDGRLVDANGKPAKRHGAPEREPSAPADTDADLSGKSSDKKK